MSIPQFLNASKSESQEEEKKDDLKGISTLGKMKSEMSNIRHSKLMKRAVMSDFEQSIH